MTGITAAAYGFPEASDHFIGGDISPTLFNIALIDDFVKNHGLLVFLTVFVGTLRRFVHIASLYAAMGYPRLGMVVNIRTVMY